MNEKPEQPKIKVSTSSNDETATFHGNGVSLDFWSAVLSAIEKVHGNRMTPKFNAMEELREALERFENAYLDMPLAK